MVYLMAHQAGWAEAYRREAVRVKAALAHRIDAIEHIGSTAVPTLMAKPIIDMAARVAPAEDPFALGEPLRALGYVPHTGGPRNHAVYVRTDGLRRTHILHAFRADQWPHCNQRLFRDKLLHDPEARRRYQDLKASIARLAGGRDYTAAKTSLIEELLNGERAARGLPPVPAWEKEVPGPAHLRCAALVRPVAGRNPAGSPPDAS